MNSRRKALLRGIWSVRVYGWMVLTDNSYDKIHNVRKNLIEALKKQFPCFGLW